MATVYRDVFGSVERRRIQEEKDAAELAAPVRSIFSGGAKGAFLNLRPIEERVAAAPDAPIRVGRDARRRRAKARKASR